MLLIHYISSVGLTHFFYYSQFKKIIILHPNVSIMSLMHIQQLKKEGEKRKKKTTTLCACSSMDQWVTIQSWTRTEWKATFTLLFLALRWSSNVTIITVTLVQTSKAQWENDCPDFPENDCLSDLLMKSCSKFQSEISNHLDNVISVSWHHLSGILCWPL